jgi:hydroxypyruvate reductase
MLQPTATLRQHCLSLLRAGIAAADPYAAVAACLRFADGGLQIRLDPQHPDKIRSGHWSKIHLIAFGKAACRMTEAARDAIPADYLAEAGIVVTNDENLVSMPGFEVLTAGHPLPDERGQQAAQKAAERASVAQQGELVLVLISGGGSAMLPYPVDGISLDDKVAATQLLLASGATINEINCVRKHLSRLKGGGLAKLAAPADLHALILSDVLGDDLSAIASGPTVADDSSFADAIAVFQQRNLWQRLPESVQNHLQQGEQGLQPETLKSGDPILQRATQTLVGSNAISVDAIETTAAQLGYQTSIYSKHLAGEARQAAELLARHCKALVDAGLSAPSALIAGGETTVTLTGSGKGGRNQEMALAFALSAEAIGLSACWSFLSGGSDGRDGPTDAAGGLVDPHSLQRMRNAGIEPRQALNNNDSYPALHASGDLVITGATGTNVADLQIILLHPTE